MTPFGDSPDDRASFLKNDACVSLNEQPVEGRSPAYAICSHVYSLPESKRFRALRQQDAFVVVVVV